MSLTAAHVAMLACPVCRDELAQDEGGLRCARQHRFDMTRQGTVTLVRTAIRHRADSAQMVAARDRWLTVGHYRPIAQHCIELVNRHVVGPKIRRVIDVGGGTGWWLARFLDAWPSAVGLTFDVSQPAVRRAAKVHTAGAAVRCDVWQDWPLRDESVDVAATIFAPRNPAELQRVVRRDGIALVVTPQSDHLQELREEFGLLSIEADKRDRLMRQFNVHLQPVAHATHRSTIAVSANQVADVIAMGPSAHHRSMTQDATSSDSGRSAPPQRLTSRLASSDRRVTVAVNIDIFMSSPNRAGPVVG